MAIDYASHIEMAGSTKSIVVLTGAGISAESGLRTFRDNNGLWEEHRVQDVATPEGFARNPALVDRFYNERRAQLHTAQSNAAHRALAELEQRWSGSFLLVTQNVDDLHERAGSKKLLHMHGELLRARCLATDAVHAWHEPIDRSTPCPCCRTAGNLRPHIVWFGEMPLHLDEISAALADCTLFISVGTSGEVYPAAGFVQMTSRDCRRIEVNPAGTSISHAFGEHRTGPAGVQLPKLVAELLAG
ncbi:MAG: NAD-dependent deacylase [Nevskiales bacterium]